MLTPRLQMNPALFFCNPGQNFTPPVYDFEYTLNGNPVEINSLEVTWISGSYEGMFDVDLYFNNLFDSLSFLDRGAQAYSGSESNPTILAGVYPVDSTTSLAYVDYNSGSVYYYEPIGGDLYIAEAATPEISSLPMVLTGLLLVVLFWARKHPNPAEVV